MIQEVKIGKSVIIGARTVISDIHDNVTAVGVPAERRGHILPFDLEQ